MIKLTKSEYKKYENVTIWEILGACALGAVLGGGLMALYILRTGGF
jgi:hypothetical protein